MEKIENESATNPVVDPPQDTTVPDTIPCKKIVGDYTLDDGLRVADAVWRYVDVFVRNQSPRLDWQAISESVPWSPRECQRLWRFFAYEWKNNDGFSHVHTLPGGEDEDISDSESNVNYGAWRSNRAPDEVQNELVKYADEIDIAQSKASGNLAYGASAAMKASAAAARALKTKNQKINDPFGLGSPTKRMKMDWYQQGGISVVEPAGGDGYGYEYYSDGYEVEHPSMNDDNLVNIAAAAAESNFKPTQKQLVNRKKPNFWTKEEDEKLLGGIRQLGAGNWIQIQEFTKIERNSSQMSQRWDRMVKRVQSGHADQDWIEVVQEALKKNITALPTTNSGDTS